MEKVLFKSEEKKSRQDVADFLRNLADRVEQGQVVLRQGNQEVQVELPEQLTLENKLEEESKTSGTKMSLEVELEWPKDGQQGPSGVELA